MRENITMHFVQAKGILSQNNGMNIYRGCSTAAFIVTAAADVTVLHTPLKISRSRKMLLNCWSRHYVQNGTNA